MRVIPLSSITVLSLVLFALTCWSAEKKDLPKPSNVYEYKTIKRKGREYRLKLHVFNPASHKAAHKSPCIVLFHSGGWSSGTPARFFRRCKELANLGMVAMSAEYSIAKVHQGTPFDSVTDAKSAIRWVRANAKKLGVNPDMIAAGGSSAGGHVAAAAAHLTAFDEKSENLAVSSRPNALVLRSPVFDNSPSGYGHGKVKKRWQEFSPLHNVKKGAPPAIVFLGDNEAKYIKTTAANTYRDDMKAVGSRCDLYIYKGETHGCWGKSADIGKKSNAFLASLGYITQE